MKKSFNKECFEDLSSHSYIKTKTDKNYYKTSATHDNDLENFAGDIISPKKARIKALHNCI